MDALGFDASGVEENVWTLAAECDQQLARDWLERSELVVRGDALAAAAGRAEFVGCEIAGSFLVSDLTAADLLAEARVLMALPALRQAVSDGRVRLPHARKGLAELVSVEDALHEQVLADVLGRIDDQPPAQVGRIVRRAVLRADPAAAERRRQTAKRGRGLSLFPARDAMADLVLTVTAEVGVRIFGLACAATDIDDGSGRSADTRRADWIVEQILRGAERDKTGSRFPSDNDADADADADAALDGRRRRSCQALVTISVTTALGLDDEPCELAGYGPISEALLDMIGTSSVQPVDPEPQYRPSVSLARTVRTRTPRCDFPCCSVPATRCDLDHTRPWPRGSSEAANLGPRSRRHHGANQAGWTPSPLPDGSTLWHAPSGRTYRRPPDRA